MSSCFFAVERREPMANGEIAIELYKIKCHERGLIQNARAAGGKWRYLTEDEVRMLKK